MRIEFFFVGLLAFIFAQTDTAEDVAATLDSQDKNRYIMTFCHLSRKSSFYRRFELETKCLMKVEFYMDQVN